MTPRTTRIAALGAFAFLGIAVAFLGVLAVANGQTKPGTGVHGEYSGAFANWLYRTNEVAIDTANLRFSAESGGAEDVLLGQVELLVNRQDFVNRNLRDAVAPAEWQAQHTQVLELLRVYDNTIAAALADAETSGFERTVAVLDAELVLLLDHVITCYAKSPACV